MQPIKSFIALAVVLLFQNFAKAHNPTWTDGIACIVYSHCTGCHNQNGIAPFSLLTYDDVYQNRYSIAASVQARSMPPFPANQALMKYAHTNTLSDHEIDEIVDWVNNFAPLGDADNIPASPIYTSSYQISTPDFIGQIPSYTVNSNKDVYRMFVIPINNATQQSVQSVEVVPGNREIVHHVLVFQDTSSIPFTLDQNDPLPGYSGFGGTGSPSSRLITGYTPGQGVFHFPPGFGAVLLSNSYLVVQVHYPSGVNGELDSTQVRIKYGPPTLRNVTTIAALNHGSTLVNGPLYIPANTVKTFYNKIKNNNNRTITGIMPHMHLIGKSIKAYCVTPSNDTIYLIDIPHWDFHWQYFYQFQKPILLPAGSIVYGEAKYDNTTDNPNNPNNPPLDISLGEGTSDEMFLIYMNLSSYLSGDTDIVIDTLSHYPHNSACNETNSTIDFGQLDINVFPNPTSSLIQIEGAGTSYLATIYNSEGIKVLTQHCEANVPLNIRQLGSGVYYLQIKTVGNCVLYKKIIRQ